MPRHRRVFLKKYRGIYLSPSPFRACRLAFFRQAPCWRTFVSYNDLKHLRRVWVSIILILCKLVHKVRGTELKSIYDIQQFLKSFGTIIYVGDRLADLELMEAELKDMYKAQLIQQNEFQTAIMLLRHEIRLEREKRQN